MVSTVRDANNVEWLSLGSDFRSEFGTGTVAHVYVSVADTGRGIAADDYRTFSTGSTGVVQCAGNQGWGWV